MKNRMILTMCLVSAGVMTYLLFSGGDAAFYQFPWPFFAGIGILSWGIQEVLKLVKKVEKECSK